ncbi:hypothetical protein COB72_10200 [bacterium]|nr:MAG: hypothetical protein COB72_10200 [bacterium]
MSQSPHNHDDRLGKLEESAGYSDHHIEILSGEIAEINKAMLGLTRRFAHIEARLSELNNRVGEEMPNVPPPHSAGPDIPRDPL